ncbi:hypothetical protein [Meiothermus ruber]|uniref:hypothetical protein n=1 Tax=Meiothermus ruber TaxID=277 RepID=UPI0007235689|nr:hypothetical protein [Meiothermus ruber]GAO75093.1 carbon-monoxide dehydrogenase [Meiothermus ruber H328]
MIPAAFEYKRPMSLEEALSHLAQYGSDARVLAGGQSPPPPPDPGHALPPGPTRGAC